MKKINELQLHSTWTSLTSILLSEAKLISGTRSQDRVTVGGGTGVVGTQGSRGVLPAMFCFSTWGVGDTGEPISDKFTGLYMDGLCLPLYTCDLHKGYKDRKISTNYFYSNSVF